jgi:pSer/pThr/pTyr-binding forkhead associated (FHA) protein
MPVPISTGASHRIRLVPHLDSRRSLRFDPITRDVVEGDPALRIGRFTERSGMGISQANALNSNKLAFKSKVVSRAHAEVWCEPGGKFFIKDTKSSSGTFLNHVRLSAANQDSRPFELKDGDTLQLGVDYQGGTEDIYKCVRIRVEIGREWQASANAFKYVKISSGS